MRVSRAARLASHGPLQRVFEIRRREVGRMELEPPQALENRALQKFPTDLWAWPTDAEVEQWAYRGTGRAGLDDLETALADYLKRPWLQHDAIDISAINALIIAEMAERFLDVKTGAALGKANWSFIFSGGNIFAETGLAFAGKIFGFLAAWVLVPALAIGLLVQGHEMGAIITIGIWAFYAVYPDHDPGSVARAQVQGKDSDNGRRPSHCYR